MGLIAAMLSIPFNDPDFTAPDLPVATLSPSSAGFISNVTCVAVLTGGRFATGSFDGTVKVWKESSPKSGQWSVEPTLTRHGTRVTCVAALKDERFVTGSSDKTVKVWKKSSQFAGVWSVEATLTHSDRVCCVAVLPDASTGEPRFVTAGMDNMVNVWKESSLQSTGGGSGAWSVKAIATGHHWGVLCVAVLADGRFVTGSQDKTVKVWVEHAGCAGGWGCNATLRHHSRWVVTCVAVLPDASTGEPRLAIGSSDNTVKVWVERYSPRFGTWSVEKTLRGHGDSVNCVAVLADASTGEPRFVTGSYDNTVKVWKESSTSPGTWSVEATLTGHGGSVSGVAVLADGRLATGSSDKTVKVWG